MKLKIILLQMKKGGVISYLGISSGIYDLEIVGSIGCSNIYKKTGIYVSTSAVIFEKCSYHLWKSTLVTLYLCYLGTTSV